LEAFAEAVKGRRLEVGLDPVPSVAYESLDGSVLEAEYGSVPRVDGAAVDYDSWPLYGGPFMEAERGSGRLLLKYGPLRRSLDFNTLTIEEWVETSTNE
jgi:hypothetical protein